MHLKRTKQMETGVLDIGVINCRSATDSQCVLYYVKLMTHSADEKTARKSPRVELQNTAWQKICSCRKRDLLPLTSSLTADRSYCVYMYNEFAYCSDVRTRKTTVCIASQTSQHNFTDRLKHTITNTVGFLTHTTLCISAILWCLSVRHTCLSAGIVLKRRNLQ